MNYDRHIASAHDITALHEGMAGSMIKSEDADFGRHLGLKKIGAHRLVLPPGHRTSLPHAESSEEEFVFVISGRPHVWLDGLVYELAAGFAVGFPAGTGLAHTFLNNTDQDVELLVLGERTKQNNLCGFPLNPEQKNLSGIWWNDAPMHKLGPHDGRPGPLKPESLGTDFPSCIVNAPDLKKSSGWHYPGDTETFGEFARLTDPLGLKALGINYESLEPGKRSSFPHAHKNEEEFVFILSGRGSVWMNGYTYDIKAGDGIAFLAGTNIAHTLINDSTEPLLYLVVGEAEDPANEDRVYYPVHTFRNEQCKRLGFFWETRPTAEMGTHLGRPAKAIDGQIALRHVHADDAQEVLDIFLQSPNYFRNVDGCEPTLAIARHAIVDVPPKKCPEYLKEFLVIEHLDRPIGVADIHIHHPDPGTVYIGLLLLREDCFGKGLGRASYDLIEHYAKNIFKAKKFRLGVSDDNNVSSFWRKLGFRANGRSYEWKGEKKSSHVVEYDKEVQ